MFRLNVFKSKLSLHEKTMRDVASAIGINEATLYRKVNGTSDFTRNEIQIIKQFLDLTSDEVESIFFADWLAFK